MAKILQHFIDKPSSEVNDIAKARISEAVADSDFKMIQGGDEELNLLHTLSQISSIVNWLVELIDPKRTNFNAQEIHPFHLFNNIWIYEWYGHHQFYAI